MKGKRPLIGDPVKAGFLTLYVVGHINNGRLLRNAIGTKYYWQIHYSGINVVDFANDCGAFAIAEQAADFDPIVKSFLTNLLKVGA